MGDIASRSGEGLADLVLTVLTMVVVERQSGPAGLGVYSYLISVFVMARYLSNWGIARHLSAELAGKGQGTEEAGAMLARAERSLLYSSLACGVLFLLGAASGAGLTRIEESAGSYVVLGLAVMLANHNSLRISALGGWGRHRSSATVKTTRRVVLFFAVWVLSLMGVPASWLTLAFLLSEVIAAFSLFQHGFPVVHGGRVRLAEVAGTFAEGTRRLFVGDALRFVLLADFMVLGMFVGSAELGLYAEATVLMRFFLLVPLSIRPLISQRLLKAAADGGGDDVPLRLNRYVLMSFLVHSVAALIVALHLRAAMGFVFIEYGRLLPLDVFLILIPGILANSTLILAEVAYEAGRNVEVLRNTVIKVLALNLVLNFYFIPYAGIRGAAAATSMTFIAYFVLFGRGAHVSFLMFKPRIIMAGFSLYIIYTVLGWLEAGLLADALLAPALVLLMYWLAGYFADLYRDGDTEDNTEHIEEGGTDEQAQETG